MTAHQERTRVYRPWLLGWLGMLLLAMLNATLRVAVVQPVVGEAVARAFATVLLLVALTAWTWFLHGRRPLPDTRTAWVVGAVWVALTLSFEFGFGGLVEGLSWSTMLADYDVTAGRIWVLVPLWTLALPAVVHRVRSRSGAPSAAGRR